MLKLGVVGYGNLGKGVTLAGLAANDAEIKGVFTKREPSSLVLPCGVKAYRREELKNFIGELDALILCGGSAMDLTHDAYEYLEHFVTVDSFDTHAVIREHVEKADKTAKKHGTLAVVSAGWDPGLFSLSRAVFAAVLPEGETLTFWGRGVSQGHSDALRKIDGVLNAVQYTVPDVYALSSARSGVNPGVPVEKLHSRECYVALKPHADEVKVEKEIKDFPHYFRGANVKVHFTGEQEIAERQKDLSHSGEVIRNGFASRERVYLSVKLKTASNPYLTGGILVAYARAAARLKKEGKTGAFTVLDIPVSYLLPEENGRGYEFI